MRPWAVVTLSVGGTLLAAEVLLHLLTPWIGVPRGLGDWVGEHQFYHHYRDGDPLYPTGESFHPLVGWDASAVPEGTQAIINAQGFRSPHNYTVEKEKARLALIGDSFTFGLGLDDANTIDAHLGKRLGSRVQILNFSARGWGTDQMTVAATKLLTPYSPDRLIVAFIADDLERSCKRFAWGRSHKPIYKKREGKLALVNTPLPSPREALASHQSWGSKVEDALYTWLGKSRVLAFSVNPLYSVWLQGCRASHTLELFSLIQQTYPDIPVAFAHLHGELPPGFIQGMRDRKLTLLQYEPQLSKLSQRLGIEHGTVDGYHPDSNGARLIAEMYLDWLAEQDHNDSTWN